MKRIVRESKWSRAGPRGIGPTRRRLTCEKDHARAEMERVSGLSVIVLESENGNKGTLLQKVTTDIYLHISGYSSA